MLFKVFSVIVILWNSNVFACESEQDFMVAVYSNNSESVENCIRKYDVNVKFSNNMTPLMIAASRHYTALANLLIDNGADPDMRFSSVEQFFEGAGAVANGVIVGAVSSFLLGSTAPALVTWLSFGLVDWQALQAALRSLTPQQLGNFTETFHDYIPVPEQVIIAMKKYGIEKAALCASSVYAFQGLYGMYEASKNSRSSPHTYSFTPLMHSVLSVSNGDIDMLKLLVSRGSGANAVTDQCGHNALMLAIRHTKHDSKLNTVNYLLKRTRDVNLRSRGYLGGWFWGCGYDFCDVTALHMASEHASPDVVEAILSTRGVDKKPVSSCLCHGLTPETMPGRSEHQQNGGEL